MKDAYVTCYFSGRVDEYDGDIDMQSIVDDVLAGKPLRDVTHAAAKKLIAADADVAAKAQWLKDNADEIKAMGGDSEKAWRLYTQGRTDALAADLEDSALEAIAEEEVEEDEDDDEDDDGDADAEDDDGDDDEDDDEEDEDAA